MATPIDYSKLSLEDLQSEIDRERDELERLETALRAKRVDLARLVFEREAARGRWRYWREQLRLARAEADVLSSRISSALDRIRGLERDIAFLEASLPLVGPRERAVRQRLIDDYRAEKAARWTEWSRAMLRLRDVVRPRIREAEDREAKEKGEYDSLREEVRALREEISREEAEAKEIEAEIKEKEKYLPRYILYDFAKYYKYLVGPVYRRRHFEIRGTFTLPVGVDPADVLEVIEEKFDDVMLRLGIDPADFPEKGWVTAGEEVGTETRFYDTVDAVVEDKRRGYVWREPKYPTRITVTEEEVTA